MEYNNRNEVEKDYKWDLTSYYKTAKDWEKDYLKIKTEYSKIKEYKNKVTKSANMLYQTLEEYFAYDARLAKLYVYANLKHDEDLENSENALMLSKIHKTYTDFISLSSFIEPEIIKTETSKIKKMLNTQKLSKYRFYIENMLRTKEHTLSATEEELITKLTSTNSAFRNVNNTLLNSVLDYGTINDNGTTTKITNSSYRIIMQSKDRNTRKKAYEMLTTTNQKFKTIFAENLISSMKNESTMANIRKFNSSLEAELDSSNIPKDVVTSLYNVVHKRLNVYQKYLRLIKTSLGLEKLASYDLSAQILTDEMSFSVEDAQYLVTESTKIYGKEYADIISKAFNENWIDYCSYKGKSSGGYCTSCYNAHPVILLNFFGKFTDVSTIAHELGHAVHYYLSQKNNDKHNYDNDIFVAEVASLTNELILSYFIKENSRNKKLKLIAIYNMIELIQNNLFDACLEGELENKAYEMLDKNEIIGEEFLTNTIKEIKEKYYGKEVELDELSSYSWIRREHYFYPFYLYKYATGVVAAITVATKIIKNEDDIKQKYIKFLKSGDTNYPVELLKNIGIDMTKEDVYDNAISFFSDLIDEFNEESDS